MDRLFAGRYPGPIFWQLYFVLLLLINVIGTLVGSHSPADLAKSIFYAFGLVALWGLIRNVRIGWRPFWVVYFVLMLSGAGYTIANLAFGPGAPWPFWVWLAVLGVLLLTAPQWLALWLYAFRRPTIWATPSPDA